MKRLYLLRHAESPALLGSDDFDRPLSAKGTDDATALGQYIAKHQHNPDFVLCSSAARTKATLSALLESFTDRPATDYTAEIYRGSQVDYLDLIREVDDAHESVLLVGHNPVIPSLAASLMDPGGNMALLAGYAPCTMTVLDCQCENWEDLRHGQNKLASVIKPSDL